MLGSLAGVSDGLSDLWYIPSGSPDQPSSLAVIDENGNIVEVGPAANNTANDNPFPTGTWPYDYYNPHPESGPNGPYGSNGIFIFNVPGHSGLGVHSGRSGPLSRTMGCIRTTDELTQFVKQPSTCLTILPDLSSSTADPPPRN